MPSDDDLLRVDVTKDGDGFTITICGEIDLSNDHDLVCAARLALSSARCATLTLDLAGVTFMDCSGLTALLTINSACEQRSAVLTITNANSSVRQLVKLADLDGVLNLN